MICIKKVHQISQKTCTESVKSTRSDAKKGVHRSPRLVHGAEHRHGAGCGRQATAAAKAGPHALAALLEQTAGHAPRASAGATCTPGDGRVFSDGARAGCARVRLDLALYRRAARCVNRALETAQINLLQLTRQQCLLLALVSPPTPQPHTHGGADATRTDGDRCPRGHAQHTRLRAARAHVPGHKQRLARAEEADAHAPTHAAERLAQPVEQRRHVQRRRVELGAMRAVGRAAQSKRDRVEGARERAERRAALQRVQHVRDAEQHAEAHHVARKLPRTK
eukprot:6207764-Pleurochrysis_carterae.AAC.5